jgi:hypothetical protein
MSRVWQIDESACQDAETNKVTLGAQDVEEARG